MVKKRSMEWMKVFYGMLQNVLRNDFINVLYMYGIVANVVWNSWKLCME